MAPIKFLTLNTWGLKFVSHSREQRLRAIADRIAADPSHDVVALQEVWCQGDWDYVERTTQQSYPYRRWFYSGIISGPGLAVLSKLPIESTWLYRFPINGRPSAFWRGDWYVGKSVSVTLLRPQTADSPPVALLNSHMHAPYALEGDAAYECHRACQAWDFAKLSKLLTQAGYAVVIVGDLNSRPGSLPHKFLTLETGLVDSWEQLYGIQDLEYIKTLPPDQQIVVGGTTCDSLLNTWRADRDPTEACRLDYALIDGTMLRAVDAQVVFTEQIEGVGSYSDHFGYSCTLETKKDPLRRSESITTIDRVDYHDQMLQLLEKYNKVSRWQMKWRAWHFFLSLAVVIAIAIVTTFTSNVAGWSSVFWVIAAVVAGITGLVDGLIALLFGRSELRALQEVKLEVLDAKRAMTAA